MPKKALRQKNCPQIFPCYGIKTGTVLHIVRSRKGKNMTLEELLGADLYSQVQAKIDEVNNKETDKLKHVRYADLSEGNYVGKGKYDADIEKLNTLISTKDSEIANANKLIDDLKKTIIATNQLRNLGGEKSTTIDDINDYIINGRNKK